MSEHKEIEKQIMLIHDLFWDALAKRDPVTRFSFCCDDITFIGSGLGERAESKAAYMEINKKGIEQFPEPFNIQFLWKRLSVFGNAAWIESEVVWAQEINKHISKERLRNTTILKYENSKWLIAHVHGSAPDYRLQGGDFMTNSDTIIRNNELERQVYERTDELNKTLKDLKATQNQLIQSEKMASLGELTAGIAHEIQNPLNFVNNFSEVNAELIEEMVDEVKKGNTEEAISIANDIKENEQKINHHGKRADAIVKGMLQHSRSSSGIKEPTDINALCDEYLRLSYHGLRAKDKSFNATLKTDFDPSIGKINIIPQDFGRVMLNLLNNAFYAVAEKKKQKSLQTPPERIGINSGETSASTNEVYEPIVTVTTRRLSPASGGWGAEITVSDNGNGIPSSIKEKIFQPFFTTKPTGQGTGLGLSLSYDIVKVHGGELTVETKENEARPDDPVGRGTTFTIQLPIA
ncbi:MAG: ATP-binding protein [Ferruginibacter sp.]